MTVLSKIGTVEYFKELPFYNNPIEKPKIKRLKMFIYWLNYLFMSS